MMYKIRRASSFGWMVVVAATLASGCRQSVKDIALGIATGSSKESVESRLGKPDEVIRPSAASKVRGKGIRLNSMYSYKKLDAQYDLWVTFDPDGKVIWATTHDKASKLFTKGL